MNVFRRRLGRWLVHLGLRVMPPGRVRSELWSLFDHWSTRLYKILDERP